MSDIKITTPIRIYEDRDGHVCVTVKFHEGSVWLSYKEIATLYGKAESTISEHLKDIMGSGEHDPKAVVRKSRTTASDGKKYDITYYNLDIIITVGYRVKSDAAIAFRRWANQHLIHILANGYTIDERQITDSPAKHRALVEHAKTFRAIEHHTWRKLLDIYATATDYDANSKETRMWIAMVQNKIHYAIHGYTASELIYERADRTKPMMGIQSYLRAKANKFDIMVAKNYLYEDEIIKMDRIVARVLDFAEDMVTERTDVASADWMSKLNDILGVSDRPVLNGYGSVKRQRAMSKAMEEFYWYKRARSSKAGYPTESKHRHMILDVTGLKSVLTKDLLPAMLGDLMKHVNDEHIFEVLTVVLNSIHPDPAMYMRAVKDNLTRVEYFSQHLDTSEMTDQGHIDADRALMYIHALVLGVIPDDITITTGITVVCITDSHIEVTVDTAGITD
jgi:hypothetical protein